MSSGSDEDGEAANFFVEVDRVLNGQRNSFGLAVRCASEFTVYIEDGVVHWGSIYLQLN